METNKFEAKKQEIPKIQKFIKNYCKELKLEKDTYDWIMKQAEEVVGSLVDHANSNSQIEISFSKNIIFGKRIKISVQGQKYDIIKDVIKKSSDFDLLNITNKKIDKKKLGDEPREQVENYVYKILKKYIKYKYSNGTNTVEIPLRKSEKRSTTVTFVSLLLGLAFGIICNLFVPAEINNNINEFILLPVNTIFLNAIKLVVIPVVFFSIATSIGSFASISEIGKAGLKILRVYVLTSVIAILIGYAFGLSYNAVDPSLSQAVTNAGVEHIQTASQTSIDVKSTLISIVPGNIVEPFLNNSMLAIIFVSILVGIGLRTVKSKASLAIKFFNEMNDLFLNITGLIIKFLPIAIFSSMAMVLISFTFDTLMSLLGLIGMVVLALFTMLAVYGLLILLWGKLKPSAFYKNVFKLWLTALSLCSSAASMPVTMQICRKLGISRKLYTFSIPLGCTINMDGAAIQFSIVTLFMAKVFGIDLDFNVLISLGITILLLSIAAPGVPGAGLVSCIIAFASIGIPAEAISLVLGINIIMECFSTANNVIGDVGCTLLVAKSENYFDKNKYYGKKEIKE